MTLRSSLTLVLPIGLLLAGLGLPAGAHHDTRTDDRIVEPYGLPVIYHIPIIQGYEPFPTPAHCLPGAGVAEAFYSEGFEGSHGYAFLATPLSPQADNLWRATTWAGPGGDSGHGGPGKLYFGQPATGNFHLPEGAHVAGTAQSPPIALPAEGSLTLEFATKWNVEWLKGYDHLWVEAVDEAGTVHLLCTSNALDRGDGTSDGDSHRIGSCSPILFAPCPDQYWLEWETRHIPVPGSLAGQIVRLQFTFDSSDPVANKFMGWMVDDVRIGTSA